MSDPETRAPRNRWTSWRFLVSAGVLLICATAVPSVLDALAEYYTKKTIDIRLPYEEFDHYGLPSFRPAEQLQTIAWTEQDIQTDEKLTAGFVEKDPVGDDIGEALLHLAYYSDPRHRVSHTPEVCLRQAGATIDRIESVQFTIPDMPDGPMRVDARVVDLRIGPSRMIDVYFFYCNGRTYNDREELRWAIGMPGDPYIYFAKVEAAVIVSPELTPAQAQARAQKLLSEVLPILARDHLPSNEQVRRASSGESPR